MGRYRLSDLAKVDIATILSRSADLHGLQARVRYRALLTAAMRRVATEPEGPSTTDHAGLLPGIRSFHIRHGRTERREARVASPVHVIFYRALQPGLVEVVRVLHQRMDPRRHIMGEGGAPERRSEESD